MGGAERIAINIAKSQSGVEYHMIEVAHGSSPFSIEFKKEMEDAGIIYHCSNIDNNKKSILYFPFRLKRLICEFKPDIIHTHTEVPDLGLFLTYKLFPGLFKKIGIVRTLHNTVLWDKWKYIGICVEKFFQLKNANVSNSKKITAVYNKTFGPDNNISLIYNGFNSVAQIPYDGIVEGKINVLFAGRFHEQKGLPVLIKTIKGVSQDKFFFHIAGKGDLERELREGLMEQKNVNISGPIFGLSKYLSSFDYVFIPSVHEGLNSLSIEASLGHTPVIINNCDGLNETVPSDYPLKVDDNNIDDFVKLFSSIEAEDPKKYADLSYNYAIEHFSMIKMQNEYEKLYRLKIS